MQVHLIQVAKEREKQIGIIEQRFSLRQRINNRIAVLQKSVAVIRSQGEVILPNAQKLLQFAMGIVSCALTLLKNKLEI